MAKITPKQVADNFRRTYGDDAPAEIRRRARQLPKQHRDFMHWAEHCAETDIEWERRQRRSGEPPAEA